MIEFMDTSSVRHTIRIVNYSKYHVELDAVPDRLGCGLLAASVGPNQAFYIPDQMSCPVFTDDADNIIYHGKGTTIPGVHAEGTQGSAVIDGGVWTLPLSNSKDQMSFAIKFLGRDQKTGEIKRSWTVSLHAPSDSAGGKVTASLFSAVTFGLAGQTNYHHYAGVWAGDKSSSRDVDYAYDNCKHVKSNGKAGGASDGKSTAYWESWDAALVELCDS